MCTWLQECAKAPRLQKEQATDPNRTSGSGLKAAKRSPSVRYHWHATNLDARQGEGSSQNASGGNGGSGGSNVGDGMGRGSDEERSSCGHEAARKETRISHGGSHPFSHQEYLKAREVAMNIRYPQTPWLPVAPPLAHYPLFNPPAWSMASYNASPWSYMEAIDAARRIGNSQPEFAGCFTDHPSSSTSHK